MCGIAGVIKSGGEAESAATRKMMEALAHRGPDGEGLYCHDGVALGHKRLAIIDPKGGHQPMANDAGNIWIVFNGAIYNYLELRQELIALGHTFTTYTDTEVLVHLYEEYGEECLHRLNGMFSFVIHDQNKRRIFAARDRFGIKPFYYALRGGKFIFASEPKALFASGLVQPECNPDGLRDYITFQFTMGQKTMFKGIHKLEPGHSLTIDLARDVNPSIRQWWDMHFEIDTDHTEEYFAERLSALLSDAVKLRMRADVPVGSYLSGGLDSSTVVMLAKEAIGGAPLHTFTGTFDEGEAFDETRYARLVADAAGTTHHELHITAQDFLDTFEKAIWAMDEPGAGPGIFPQFMVSRMAQEHVKVVLGGQGGDEIFTGYTRYLVAYLEEVLRGGIFETADKSKHAVTLESIVPNLPVLKQYVPMLRTFWKSGLFETREKRYFSLVDRSEGMTSFFTEDVFSATTYQPFDAFCEVFNRKGHDSYINQMCYFDCKASLPALLQVDDRTGMAFGLESRLPLLDYRIAELHAKVSPAIKFAGGKSKVLFRQAIRNLLPGEILNRKDKMGFPVPLHLWYKGELRDYVRELLLSERARSRGLYNAKAIEGILDKDQGFSRVLWGLMCLEQWHRAFIDAA